MKTERAFLRIRSVLVLGVLFAALAIGAATPAVHVIIMHTNDIHGHIQSDPSTGGAAALRTIVRRIQPDLLLDAGDMFTGSMISDKFQGAAVIDIMNAIGYGAAAIGNHEFDYGLDALRDRAVQAHFPFLSANTVSIDDVLDAAIFNTHGVRIAVIGGTTEEVARTGHPKYMKDVEVTDIVRGIERALANVRGRADFIILLTHTNNDEELRLARAFPEIRLIIGGHDHNELQGPLRVGNTTIVRAGSYGRFVGRIDLTLDSATDPEIRTQLIPVKDVEPDPEVARILASYEEKVAVDLRRVVGEATGDLGRSSSAESHVSNLVADAIRWKTAADIVLMNVGQQRVPIAKGAITGRTLFEVLPFQNTVIMMKLSGAQIKRILGHGIMTISGVRVRLDLKKPDGQRLEWIGLADGKDVADTQLYSVATNDFLQAGGDGFKEFAEGQAIEDTGLLLRDAVAEYIERVRTIAPILDGRIRVTP